MAKGALHSDPIGAPQDGSLREKMTVTGGLADRYVELLEKNIA